MVLFVDKTEYSMGYQMLVLGNGENNNLAKAKKIFSLPPAKAGGKSWRVIMEGIHGIGLRLKPEGIHGGKSWRQIN